MEDIDNIYDISLLDHLEKEKDDGNIEYKRELLNLDDEIINRRMTQMKYRIYEGLGEALYFIGVTDDGNLIGLNKEEYIQSIKNLELIATKINCIILKISESNKKNQYVGEYLIRENDKNNYIELKIGVAGNVDSGKTTTIGTLTKGILDDGRGKARVHVFNYKHEIDSGRTSSIGHQIMGYDKNGNVINTKLDKQNAWADISSQSAKLISFFDLAGHEKYLRTTIYGLSSLFPDYCLIMIGANMGINHMSREHIGLCLNLKIPFIILVTKIDIVPDNILNETMQKINNMCKNRARKIPYIIKNISDVINVVKNIKSDSIVPIMQISNVSSLNLDLLKTLFNLLPLRYDFSQYIDKSVELLIDSTYSVTGHSTIISGLLKSGKVKVNDNLLIGPFGDSSYKQVKVRSIHLNYRDLKEANPGSFICLSLKNITRKEIKKGMILITDDNKLKVSVKKFIAQIHILHSPTTIKNGYQPFIHIDHVRQSVKMNNIKKIESINDNNNIIYSNDTDTILRTGDKATVQLEFIIKPEYIKPSMKIIFREGKVRAVGKVIELL
jgi:GTPase